MGPFLSHALFPPPTKAWLQTVSWDPEAQGWGAWRGTEKTPLGSGSGGGREEQGGEAEEDERDASFLLSLLELESPAESPEPDQVHGGHGPQELEAIKLKLWALEQAKVRLEPPSVQGKTRDEDSTGAGQLPSSPRTLGCPFPGTPKEKVEADHRSIYVGNVDYGGTARELEAHFHHCGEVHRVTILCDKFSGHPKGYAYIEFASKSSAQAAMELDESVFRGRVIKVCVSGVLPTPRPPLHCSAEHFLTQESSERKTGAERLEHLPKDTQLPQPILLCVPRASGRTWPGRGVKGASDPQSQAWSGCGPGEALCSQALCRGCW
ncbi:Embryonic polyadenylate-binding protein 2 [Sciurus carolinensis]|uniref:Embryonic polyadenylate-binding protein 2 n=1 Tax=Sciurus carolinensis TaxID=30640 RepID=A0AA41MHP2_SCICA|nr:Embryonic polyadenylate-binding protein 2 [Sciurus carolinensis]